MAKAPVVLNHCVFPFSPPNAEPLLLPMDVKAYVISVSPWGPELWRELSVECIASDAAVNPRTTTGTNTM